ncbi:MAG: hypothetical protein ACMUIP_15875 [bacterium]
MRRKRGVFCEGPIVPKLARRLSGGCGILQRVCGCKRRDTAAHLIFNLDVSG